MEIKQIRYFIELAQELHFWNTAERMFITQSALSRQIQSLESELGFPLFERDKRNVKITLAGQFLYDRWKPLLQEIDNLHHHAKQIATGEFGTIKIAHPGSITYSILPDLINLLTQKHPNLNVFLVEMITEDLEKALLNFNVDIGFRREVSQNKQLETRRLYKENFALVLSENHSITKENFEGMNQVKNEKFILPSLGNKTKYIESLKMVFAEANYFPEPYIQSEFGTTIIRMIKQGMGVSILPISYAASIPQGVKFIKLPQTSYLYMQWRKGDNNPVLSNFIELVENFEYPKI